MIITLNDNILNYVTQLTTNRFIVQNTVFYGYAEDVFDNKSEIKNSGFALYNNELHVKPGTVIKYIGVGPDFCPQLQLGNNPDNCYDFYLDDTNGFQVEAEDTKELKIFFYLVNTFDMNYDDALEATQHIMAL